VKKSIHFPHLYNISDVIVPVYLCPSLHQAFIAHNKETAFALFANASKCAARYELFTPPQTVNVRFCASDAAGADAGCGRARWLAGAAAGWRRPHRAHARGAVCVCGAMENKSAASAFRCVFISRVSRQLR
jgi:hypothetical protein